MITFQRYHDLGGIWIEVGYENREWEWDWYGNPWGGKGMICIYCIGKSAVKVHLSADMREKKPRKLGKRFFFKWERWPSLKKIFRPWAIYFTLMGFTIILMVLYPTMVPYRSRSQSRVSNPTTKKELSEEEWGCSLWDVIEEEEKIEFVENKSLSLSDASFNYN